MKRYLFKINYMDDNVIKHYDCNDIIKQMNEYNKEHNINHTINRVKIHEYLNKRSVPKYIKSIEKIKIDDLIQIPSRLNCKIHLKDYIT
jgi:hypothetical protein